MNYAVQVSNNLLGFQAIPLMYRTAHTFCAHKRNITYTLTAYRSYHCQNRSWKLLSQVLKTSLKTLPKKKKKSVWICFYIRAGNTRKWWRNKEKSKTDLYTEMACASLSKAKEEEPDSHLAEKKRRKAVQAVLRSDGPEWEDWMPGTTSLLCYFKTNFSWIVQM